MFKRIALPALVFGTGLLITARTGFGQEKKIPPPGKPAVPGSAGAAGQAPAAPSAADLVRRAQTAMDQGRPQDALPLLRQASQLDPKSIQSRVLLGRALVALRQFPAAAQAFQSAVDLSPGEPEFLYYLGIAQSEQAQYAAARSTFNRAVEIAPADVRYRMAVADTYLAAKEYLPARTSLLEALGFAPDNADVHSRLGDLDEQENRHAEALDEYDTALRIDSASVGAKLGRSASLAGLKRFAEAEKIARDLIAQNAASADAHSALAQVLDAEGKHLSAIAEYRIALAAAPANASLWGNLGWSQYEEGLLDESVTSGRKALELDPKQAYVKFNIGLAYAARDQWTQASKEYSEGIAIAAVPDIHSAAGDLRDAISRGKPTGAMRQALDMVTRAELKASGLPDDVLSLLSRSK